MSPPPNVLLLYVDQLRWDALGCAGNPDVLTPNLDALAARGTRFTHHFVQNPVCMPSRLSMLTGRYPANLGITEMAVPVPPGTETVATRFAAAGYRTANIGKLHFLPHSNRDHREPHPSYGFHHLEISDEPGPYDDAYRAFVRRVAPKHLPAVSLHVDPPAARVHREVTGRDDGIPHPRAWSPWTTAAASVPWDLTHTAFVGRRVRDFLGNQAAGGTPFFCVAGFYSPHSPLVAPQRFLDLYDPKSLTPLPEPDDRAGLDDPEHRRQALHGYYAMISEVDHWVGEILSELARAGHAEDTVVAFTGDHGESLGDFGRWGKSFPGEDCVSRVPLLVASPGQRPGVCDALVEAVDLVPTLCELCGVVPSPDLDGASLRAAIDAPAAFAGKGEVLMEGSLRKPAWRSIRTRTHRYVLDAAGEEIVHELAEPFGESRNAAGEIDPAVLAELRHRLATRVIASHRGSPAVWPY
ncbi:sulfatase family protein [Phycisphaera mikurensis]|uniref:Sulfatase n=1 Tax=Phycisphaera mikurensis (strain NBRC 102666 / KCTC 22515 / FYK2301M01) TaxID=1142394 RepID=I0IDG6_PHYMF|nr:sulfatase-like hydrolase/transferase [Phycisphaera mikurensis]MBB6441124.1 arylsulfatase A-like enzyme [Phycisphaera mikurensis]BAM03304.1 sulfatase [Phycisphaera mikurensis NBRC 102666]